MAIRAAAALSNPGLWQFPAPTRCVDWGYGNRGEAPTGRSSRRVAPLGVMAGRFLPQPQLPQRAGRGNCHNPGLRNGPRRAPGLGPSRRLPRPPLSQRAGKRTRMEHPPDCHNPELRNMPRRAPGWDPPGDCQNPHSRNAWGKALGRGPPAIASTPGSMTELAQTASPGHEATPGTVGRRGSRGVRKRNARGYWKGHWKGHWEATGSSLRPRRPRRPSRSGSRPRQSRGRRSSWSHLPRCPFPCRFRTRFRCPYRFRCWGWRW